MPVQDTCESINKVVFCFSNVLDLILCVICLGFLSLLSNLNYGIRIFEIGLEKQKLLYPQRFLEKVKRICWAVV